MNCCNKKIIHYFLEFICLLVSISFPLIFFLFGKPFSRGFYCDDETILYPYRESTISFSVLCVLCISIPMLMFFCLEFFKKTHSTSNTFEAVYNQIVSFIFGAVSSIMFTCIAKYCSGRLKPSFIDICKPNVCQSNSFDKVYHEKYQCSGPSSLVKNARLSFISSHATLASYSAVYTVIYLQTSIKYPNFYILRSLFQTILLYLAFYVGLTQLSDYEHHWEDVFAGFAIGTFSSILTFCYITKSMVNSANYTKELTN